MSLTEITESGYYNAVEGVLHSDRFGCDIHLLGRKIGEEYLIRCAEYFEALPDNLLETLKTASAAYLSDFLEEHEGELDVGGLEVTEENVLSLLIPVQLIAAPHELLAEEDAPPAFGMKMMFTPVSDEYVEWAVRGDTAVYVGEYREVSPWNEKIRSKEWNYLNRI